MIYPRNLAAQVNVIADWRARVKSTGGPDKPVMQPLYIDLTEDPDTPPQPIHLGVRTGTRHLSSWLKSLEKTGVTMSR